MFTIDLSDDALEELRQFRKRDSTIILDEIERQLTYQPNVETRNRKPLRAHPLGEWELRVDKFRVFYDIDTENETVLVKAVGVKSGNKLFMRGKEFSL
jgi:mRNA-degrading endonuclease RelE of RelBE toxin-antitoxin system